MKQQVKKGIAMVAALLMLCSASLMVYAADTAEGTVYHSGDEVPFANFKVGDVLEAGVTILNSPKNGISNIAISDESGWVIGACGGISIRIEKDYKVTGIDEKYNEMSMDWRMLYLETYTPAPSPEPTPTPAPAPIWRPTTPEDIERWSFVAPQTPVVISEDGVKAEVDVTNSVQGPACIECFKLFKPKDYEIGYTYNIYPKGYEDSKYYHSEKEYTFTMEIPETLRTEGRTFMFLCISDKGMPYLYENEAKEADRITITADRFYAYALLYTDKAE